MSEKVDQSYFQNSDINSFQDEKRKASIDLGLAAIREATDDIAPELSDQEIVRRQLLTQRALFFALSEVSLQLSVAVNALIEISNFPEKIAVAAAGIAGKLINSNPMFAMAAGAGLRAGHDAVAPSSKVQPEESLDGTMTPEEIERLASTAELPK